MRKEKIANNGKQRVNGKASKICYLLFSICYLLFAACQVQVVPEQSAIPGGMGRVTLNLNDVSARTILPASNALNLTDFASYQLVFTATSGGEDRTVTPDITGSSFEPIHLVQGTYGLTVNAYKTAGTPPTNLAARGQVGGIVVNPNVDTPVDVVLRAVMDEQGSVGNFSWDITLNTGDTTLTTATMTILNSSGNPVGAVVDLTTTPIENRNNLPVGVYTVRFNLAGSDTTSPRAVVWNELMYVYATLTSNFKHEFTNNYFHRTHWNVTFNHNYIEPSATEAATADDSVMHGAVATAPNPPRTGYTLVGWNSLANGTGTTWNFANPVHNNMTLYAQWQRVDGTVTVTLDVEAFNDAVITVTPASPTFSLASNTSVPVSVTAMTIGGTTVNPDNYTFKWEITGKGAYANQTVEETGTSIDLNDSANRHIYGTVGNHTITLTATPVAGGGRTYQRNVDFTIN